MSVPTLTFDGLNINDGTTYRLQPGARPGARKKSWDEYRGLSGAVTQANVSEAYYVESHWPLIVAGSSLADLNTKVQAINTKIDGCTATATKALVFAGTIYQIAASPSVEYEIGQREANAFWTKIDLALFRVP